MNSNGRELHQVTIQDHGSLGHPDGHAQTMQLFKNSVILPSLVALSQKMKENVEDHEAESLLFDDDLADLYQSTVAGYLLTIQSMWERGLRSLLINRDASESGGKKAKALQRANWSEKGESLQWHFEQLLNFPLTAFDSYKDLHLLQNFGNAIRHGDGDSAQRLYDLAPSMWSCCGWLAPGMTIQAGPHTVTAPLDGPKYPSFNTVTIERKILEQMIQSVTDFWEDLECIRINSFARKSDSVVKRLDAWPEIRRHRLGKRLWHAC